ncbi:MAG: STAS/SEC14 domain-containing protein [Armatimonadetes bacterium]|nr:STAS/SEC14 domain-containing protein [Armatimonadota bacterium]
MNIVMEPETKQWARREAERRGIAPEVFVSARLRDQARQEAASLPANESELLTRINEGMPADFWTRYRDLIAKREAKLLTGEEQEELIRLSDVVEQKNAERVPHLVTLARLRRVSLAELIGQLGLQPASVSA